MGKRTAKRKYNNSKSSSFNARIKKTFRKKKNNYKEKIRKLNPSIFFFSINDSFIFQPTLCMNFYDKIEDYNLIKPNDEELEVINLKIKEIESNDNQKKIVYILPSFKAIMENLEIIEPQVDDRANKIKEIIQNWPKESSISIKKITEAFNQFALSNNKNTIQKSMTFLIMKNILKLSYKKTTVKTDKLLNNTSILQSFFFLKIVVRCLIQKMTFIYLDESGFSLKNSSYRTWRLKKQEIYFQNKNSKRTNLIMAVSPNKVFHYKLLQDNVNSDNFKVFIEEMITKMNQDEKKMHVIILDNCTSHLTENIFEVFHSNNIKVLFGVPYLSKWNMIENVFRFIKNYTYKRLYKNISSLENDIKNIIDNKINKIILSNLFREVLIEYTTFINEKTDLNLNNI